MIHRPNAQKIKLKKFKELFYEKSLPNKEIAEYFNVVVSAIGSFRHRYSLPPRGWSKGIPPRTGSKMPKWLRERLHRINSNRTGAKNPRWCGDTRINNQGYICKRVPGHPHAEINGFVREHRLVMEKKLRRYLKPTETVHHLNGIKTDNRVKNLVVCSNSEHHKLFHLDTSLRSLDKSPSHKKHNSRITQGS